MAPFRRIARAAAACILAATVPAVGAAAGHAAEPPTGPRIELRPTADVVDGTRLEVVGAGFGPGATVRLTPCLADGLPTSGCRPQRGTEVVAEHGSFTLDYPVHRALPVDGVEYDCAATPCVVRAEELVDGQVRRTASAPIAFTPTPLTVTVEPVGTVSGRTGHATVRVRVACERATPVSLHLVLTADQHGATFTRIASDGTLRCTPGTPTLAHLASSSPDTMAAGTAAVVVSAASFQTSLWASPWEPTADQQVTATVELVEHEELARHLAATAAQPDQAAMRAELAAAFSQRRNDLSFQEEWRWERSGSAHWPARVHRVEPVGTVTGEGEAVVRVAISCDEGARGGAWVAAALWQRGPDGPRRQSPAVASGSCDDELRPTAFLVFRSGAVPGPATVETYAPFYERQPPGPRYVAAVELIDHGTVADALRAEVARSPEGDLASDLAFALRHVYR